MSRLGLFSVALPFISIVSHAGDATGCNSLAYQAAVSYLANVRPSHCTDHAPSDVRWDSERNGHLVHLLCTGETGTHNYVVIVAFDDLDHCVHPTTSLISEE